MSNKEQEIWKTYPEYDFIEVSNLGRVRTKDRTVIRSDGRKQFAKGRVLKQQLQRNGYMYVGFRVSGKEVCLIVHRMVAICFIPNPNGLPEVNHIDCDPTNNRVDNLEWCTRQYNSAYRDKLGHTAKHNAPKKPVFAVNPKTFEVFYFESQHKAARQLGTSAGNVNYVLKEKQNKAKGSWFAYADENAVEKTRVKFGDEIAEKVKNLLIENNN